MLSALTLGATHGALMTDYDINGTNIWSGKFVYIIQLSRKLSSSRNRPIGLVTGPMSYYKKRYGFLSPRSSCFTCRVLVKKEKKRIKVENINSEDYIG